MLHILFLILKIIGIILAVILGLILLVICIVLFVPICYKADLHGSGNARELTVHAKVSWLFGLIKAVFALENGKTDLSVRIAWKKFGDSDPVEDKAEDRIEEKPKPEKKSVMQEKQVIQGEEKQDDTTNRITDKAVEDQTEKAEKSEQTAKTRPESTEKKQRKKKDRKEDSDSASKIEQITEKIKCTYHKFCDKINEITEKKDKMSDFLTDETHKNAFLKLKNEAFHLLKKLKPKKIQGEITFGFEDPSLTGRLLAWISMIYPWIGEHTDITPDFEHRTLSGDLSIRGRLYVITPVVTAIRLILSKAVRRSFKDIRNFKL
ncbi:DUF2953 domain-containing protein [Dorea ammoniilytica]|uniref:DUF2953 domain-containing protein n=1 Tax=Dorea ammoniilytica TaxID=2981788 RepID=A0ABT2S2S5_9FIRM|nr:DUF2953 domain-containing protein [Dorea ammoniilytica]MCU6698894.1 DUF2953 domain-containing protein [Dorea ammoniilytica]SCH01630.1 ABC-type uncharacterized transport system%2C permease component [uncultured Eubacterium sp.]